MNLASEKLKNNNKNINDVLIDGNNNWSEKKLKSQELSNSYMRIGNKLGKISNMYDIGVNMHYCGNTLVFKRNLDNEKKLIRANFCRARLCPMCNWRKSKKIFGQVSKIIKEINSKENYKYIFLTLTCKNVEADELNNQLKTLTKVFNEMTRNTKIKKMCKGYFRGIEVTYNEQAKTYHPHIHCIIAVNSSYFTDKTYIKQKDWALLWQHYLKTDYLPVVDVRKFEEHSYKAVAEVSKYTVKYNDIVKYNDDNTVNEPLTDELVYTLHYALKNKRLVGMGGIFKEYHKKLNLEDLNKDDIDLINTDNDDNDDLLNDDIYIYNWYCGFRNYFLEKE